MNNQLGNSNLLSRSKSESDAKGTSSSFDASPPATPSPPPF